MLHHKDLQDRGATKIPKFYEQIIFKDTTGFILEYAPQTVKEYLDDQSIKGKL
jgi:hypothetical protein